MWRKKCKEGSKWDLSKEREGTDQKQYLEEQMMGFGQRPGITNAGEKQSKLEILGVCELTDKKGGSCDEEVGLKRHNRQTMTSEFLVKLGLCQSMVLVR